MATRPAAKRGSGGKFTKKVGEVELPQGQPTGYSGVPGMDTSIDMTKESEDKYPPMMDQEDRLGEKDLSDEKLEAILTAVTTLVREFGSLKAELVKKRTAGNF